MVGAEDKLGFFNSVGPDQYFEKVVEGVTPEDFAKVGWWFAQTPEEQQAFLAGLARHLADNPTGEDKALSHQPGLTDLDLAYHQMVEAVSSMRTGLRPNLFEKKSVDNMMGGWNMAHYILRDRIESPI